MKLVVYFEPKWKNSQLCTLHAREIWFESFTIFSSDKNFHHSA